MPTEPLFTYKTALASIRKLCHFSANGFQITILLFNFKKGSFSSRLMTSQLGLKVSVKPMAILSFFLISSVKPHVANHKNQSYVLGIHKSLSLSFLPIFRLHCYLPTRHFQENYIIFSLSCPVHTF